MAQSTTPALPDKFEGVDIDDLDSVAKREYRARTQRMTIIAEKDVHGDATGMYRVTSQSRSTYTVDVVNGACMCPDHEYNVTAQNHGCKHRMRVWIGITEGDLPAPGEPVTPYVQTLFDRRNDLQEERAGHLDAVDQLNALLRPLERLTE